MYESKWLFFQTQQESGKWGSVFSKQERRQGPVTMAQQSLHSSLSAKEEGETKDEEMKEEEVKKEDCPPMASGFRFHILVCLPPVWGASSYLLFLSHFKAIGVAQ